MHFIYKLISMRQKYTVLIIEENQRTAARTCESGIERKSFGEMKSW